MVLIPTASTLMGVLIAFSFTSYVSGENTISPVLNCQDLAQKLDLENATFHFAQSVPAGTNVRFPDQHPTCGNAPQLVDADICRLVFSLKTGTNSSLSVEAWLPQKWSGRFLGTGNGGLNGCIQYADLAYGASQGFATIGTNNGHNGTSGQPFLHNPGVVEDYVYRSIHTEAVVGKQIAKTFYGREHTKAYYLGCSTGGRQGFKEAQDFPEDFDGIVAGAPAFSMPALFYWSGQFYLYTGVSGSATFLTANQWKLVGEDIMKQCDGLDGAVDGILEDPDLCQYRPESLICGENQTGGCLTGTQAATVRSVFSPTYGPDGELVYPRMQPVKDAPLSFLSGQPFPYSTDWYRYVVYSDPSWDPATLSPKDWTVISEQDPFNVSTWKGDLSNAKKAGTKILHYHGLEDIAISSENSARYYNHVSRTMGLPSEDLDEFYRYFRVSGMSHCGGGNGASLIGSSYTTLDTYEPDNNVLAAMVRWVENGVAPEYIVGTRKKNGSSQITMSRKHCKYPKRNVYNGTGDASFKENWHCV